MKHDPDSNQGAAEPDYEFVALLQESGLLEVAADLLFESQAPAAPQPWQEEAASLIDQLLHLVVEHGPDGLTGAQALLGATHILTTMLTCIAYQHLCEEEDE